MALGRNSEENLNLNCTVEMIRERNCNDEKEDGRISAMKKRRGEENFNIKKKKERKKKFNQKIEQQRRNCRDKKALQGHQEREYYRLKETGNGIPTIEEIAEGTSKNCSERKPHERNSYGGGKKRNKNARKEIPAAGIASRN